MGKADADVVRCDECSMYIGKYDDQELVPLATSLLKEDGASGIGSCRDVITMCRKNF